MTIYLKEKRTVSIKQLMFAVLILPFFPPMLVEMMVEKGSALWKVIEYCYKGSQVVFASFGYVIWLCDKKRESSRWFIFLVAHLFSFVVACAANGTISPSLMGRMYSDIGFCILCVVLLKNSRKDFIGACVMLFTLLTVYGILSIYLFPRGFFNGETVYDRVWGLGAKNNAFPMFFACFFFNFLNYMEQDKSIPNTMPVYITMAIIAGMVCESVNTMLCLALVLFVYFLNRFLPRILTCVNFRVVLIAFIFILAVIYVGMKSKLMVTILAMLGRSPTFSGRTRLWEQAITYLRNNPLFGAGHMLEYFLGSGISTPHAHSQWMDKLAKYGSVQFVFLILFVSKTFKNGCKCPTRRKACVIMSLLLIYMLHMSFDTYNYDFFTLFFICANAVFVNDRNCWKDNKVSASNL